MTDPLTPLDIGVDAGDPGSTSQLEAEVEAAVIAINTTITEHTGAGDEIVVTFGDKVSIRAFVRLKMIYENKGNWGSVTISSNRLQLTLVPDASAVTREIQLNA